VPETEGALEDLRRDRAVESGAEGLLSFDRDEGEKDQKSGRDSAKVDVRSPAQCSRSGEPSIERGPPEAEGRSDRFNVADRREAAFARWLCSRHDRGEATPT